jgi:spore coat polysaccharide biosynthesis protein SpsF
MTAAIIQARMNSSRLPGKVLKKVMGKPVLAYLIERLKQVQSCEKIIIAATSHPLDSAIEQFAQENNIPVFRGNEEDVLQRFIECAELFGIKTIIRSCADSPVIDPAYINSMVEKLLQNNCDFCSGAPGVPVVSTGVEVFTLKALKKQLDMKPDIYQQEHVSLLIRESSEFKKCYIQPPDELVREDIRLTIDTEADFLFFRSIIEHFQGQFFTLIELLKFIDANPDIKKLNSHIQQKDVRLPSVKIALIVSGIDKDLDLLIKKTIVEKYHLGFETFFISPDNPAFDWVEFSQKISHFDFIYFDNTLNNMTFNALSESIDMNRVDADYLALNAKQRLGVA